MATRAMGRVRLNSERIFFTSMALAVLAAMLVGFAPSYYLRGVVPAPHPYEPLTPLVHVHALAFTSWILLFVTQTALIATGRVDLHRRLGLLGVGLVSLMIPLAIMVGIYGIGRPLTAAPGVDPRSWAALPLLDAPVFGGLIIAALLNRRRPQVHKRLMLIAMIDMLQPTLGRVASWSDFPPVSIALVIMIFLGVLATWDVRTKGRVLAPTLWGGAVVLGRVFATPMVWATPAWLSFAGWLYSLT